jgi:hypothetical protein
MKYEPYGRPMGASFVSAGSGDRHEETYKNWITMMSLSNDPGTSQLQTVTPRFVCVRRK